MTTVIVTGGASGIGRQTCLRYAARGASVVVGDVREEPREGGTPTHELIRDRGGEAMFVETDVRAWEEVRALVDRAVEEAGQIDVMVNNAGFAERAPIEEMEIADARRMFRVNVEGVYHGMKAVVPHMRERGRGSIVNISSQAGKRGVPELAAYCGSKFAVIGMTEAVAREVPRDVTVNAVCPGRTKTAMTGFEGVPVEGVAEKIVEVADADYTGRAVDA